MRDNLLPKEEVNDFACRIPASIFIIDGPQDSLLNLRVVEKNSEKGPY